MVISSVVLSYGLFKSRRKEGEMEMISKFLNHMSIFLPVVIYGRQRMIQQLFSLVNIFFIKFCKHINTIRVA